MGQTVSQKNPNGSPHIVIHKLCAPSTFDFFLGKNGTAGTAMADRACWLSLLGIGEKWRMCNERREEDKLAKLRARGLRGTGDVAPDSDDDEGAERPGKWGRSRETAAHDETAGTVHGRREGEMGGDAGARRLGNDSSGRSRSRSRSRDRPESGNVAARERSRSEDAPEPDAAQKRDTAGPGLLRNYGKAIRRIEDPGE